MELIIDVPRKFKISPDKIRQYLLQNKWTQSEYSDLKDKFTSPKYSNAIIIFPKPKEFSKIDPEDLVDIEYILFSTLRFIANVENTDIQSM